MVIKIALKFTNLQKRPQSEELLQICENWTAPQQPGCLPVLQNFTFNQFANYYRILKFPNQAIKYFTMACRVLPGV